MTLRILFTTLVILLWPLHSSVAGTEILLSRSVPISELDNIPKTLSLYLYDSLAASEPMQIQEFEQGEWQSDVDFSEWPLETDRTIVFNLQFEKPDDLLLPLWLEMRVDDVVVGSRTPLVATLPNMTVYGEIKSNTAFVFPDNSRQTTAAKSTELNTLLTASCGAESSIRVINTDGSVVCETDDNSGGTVAEIQTGVGLTGGPITSSGTVSIAQDGITTKEIKNATIADEDIDTSKVQKRITGTCPPDHILTAINADGSVTCIDIYTVIPTLPVVLSTLDSTNWIAGMSIAIGDDGNPVISYTGLDTHLSHETILKVAKCNDSACSGGDETISVVDSAIGTGGHSSIAISTDGNPVISYYDGTNKDLKVAKCNDPACAGNDETITVVDATNEVGQESDIVIGFDGYPVISYEDYTNGQLKVAKCNDSACTGGGEILSTVAPSEYAMNSIAISMDGNPVISYYAWPGSDLRVVKCNDAACSGNDEISYAVDTTGDTGRSPSIAIGIDGNPVISYWAELIRLNVAKCNDPACNPLINGPELISVVADSEDREGWGSTLAIGNDGNPVISYSSGQPSDDLRVAKCNNPACSGGNSLITTIDAIGNVGSASAMAIGRDQNPVIGYWDRTNEKLKVAKCRHPGCD